MINWYINCRSHHHCFWLLQSISFLSFPTLSQASACAAQGVPCYPSLDAGQPLLCPLLDPAWPWCRLLLCFLAPALQAPFLLYLCRLVGVGRKLLKTKAFIHISQQAVQWNAFILREKTLKPCVCFTRPILTLGIKIDFYSWKLHVWWATLTSLKHLLLVKVLCYSSMSWDCWVSEVMDTGKGNGDQVYNGTCLALFQVLSSFQVLDLKARHLQGLSIFGCVLKPLMSLNNTHALTRSGWLPIDWPAFRISV